MFVSALILFGVASLVGGAAQSQEMLVVARGIQGFSCAFMAASSLAIITSSFANEQLFGNPQIRYDARRFLAIGRLLAVLGDENPRHQLVERLGEVHHPDLSIGP